MPYLVFFFSLEIVNHCNSTDGVKLSNHVIICVVLLPYVCVIFQSVFHFSHICEFVYIPNRKFFKRVDSLPKNTMARNK